MAFTKKNDEAVSPVIGVILMVAVTVILAAVIAAFVFGMAGNLTKTKIVQYSVTKSSITNMGGQDVGSLQTATYTVNGLAATSSITALTTGTSQTASFSAGDRVIIVGHFADGSDQVILDTRV